jgi:hypothetical protein
VPMPEVVGPAGRGDRLRACRDSLLGRSAIAARELTAVNADERVDDGSQLGTITGGGRALRALEGRTAF